MVGAANRRRADGKPRTWTSTSQTALSSWTRSFSSQSSSTSARQRTSSRWRASTLVAVRLLRCADHRNAATPSQSWSPTARESLTRALDSPVRRMWRPTRSSPCSSSWPRCRPLAGKQYARLRTSRSWLHGAPSRLAPSCGCARHPARSSWTRAATSSAGKTLVAVTTTPLLAAGSGRRHMCVPDPRPRRRRRRRVQRRRPTSARRHTADPLPSRRSAAGGECFEQRAGRVAGRSGV